MSSPIESHPPTLHEFQARFGAPPDVERPEKEVERWMQMCKELLDERERLQAALAELRKERGELLRAVFALTYKDREIEFTKEELLACIGREPPIEQLIEEIKNAPEA